MWYILVFWLLFRAVNQSQPSPNSTYLYTFLLRQINLSKPTYPTLKNQNTNKMASTKSTTKTTSTKAPSNTYTETASVYSTSSSETTLKPIETTTSPKKRSIFSSFRRNGSKSTPKSTPASTSTSSDASKKSAEKALHNEAIAAHLMYAR